MPKRVYRCPKCGQLKLAEERWHEEGKHMCPDCEQPMKLIFQPPAIIIN